MSQNSDSVYLEHILEAINNIEAGTRGVRREDFNKNIQLQAAILHFIQIVGEAAKLLSLEFKEKYPEKVNVYSVGDFSMEVCGGPHVASTNVLENFIF